MAKSKPPFHAPSTIRKRSVKLNGHSTSVTVEDDFWEALAEIANRQGFTMTSLIEQIDRERLSSNLSSGIRLFVLNDARGGASSWANVDRTEKHATK